MILEDLAIARERDDDAAVNKYEAVLRHFIATHPDRSDYLS